MIKIVQFSVRNLIVFYLVASSCDTISIIRLILKFNERLENKNLYRKQKATTLVNYTPWFLKDLGFFLMSLFVGRRTKSYVSCLVLLALLMINRTFKEMIACYGCY